MDGGGEHPLSLRDYLGVLRRHKWIILICVVLFPLAAVALSLRQQRLYEATAEVLISHQNLAASLGGLQQDFTEADRLAQTQASLARVPEVAKRALAAARVTSLTADELLNDSKVSTQPNADLLDFSVTNRSRTLAERLATAYAQSFSGYQREVDSAAYASARRDVEAQMAQLRAAGAKGSGLYAELVSKRKQLRTLETLQTSSAVLVRSADSAHQVQPRPVRNGILGFVLGLGLGIGLAFLRHALDTRIRSSEEVAERLHLPLLARLPVPPKRLRAKGQLVMLEDPQSGNAEPFRILRTNTEFVNLERKTRTIMVTGAMDREGKSTTVANLAVSFARAGRRVIVADLDLRRPTLHRFFDLETGPGLTDAALGHVSLDQALMPVPGSEDGTGNTAQSANGQGRRLLGSLAVLPAGSVPPDPGEFVGTNALTDLLATLESRAEIVLLDTPPLLHVGDAITLSAKVGGMIVVINLDRIRRPVLAELQRVLASCPAEKLGFVLAGADREEGYGYESYGYYERESATRRGTLTRSG
jgi:Mrp family chromosome partitioning ATPase/capsular polysaccharide biosynthesis protein